MMPHEHEHNGPLDDEEFLPKLKNIKRQYFLGCKKDSVAAAFNITVLN